MGSLTSDDSSHIRRIILASDGSNYNDWRRLYEKQLILKGWRAVLRPAPVPSSGGGTTPAGATAEVAATAAAAALAAAALDSREEMEQKALALMVGWTDRVYWGEIDRHTTAVGALAALEKRNLGAVKVMMRELEAAFNSMTKKDDQNMEEYFEMGRDLRYKLERGGEPTSERRTLMALTKGLPPEYALAVELLENAGVDDLDEGLARLRRAEQKLKEKEEELVGKEFGKAAFLAWQRDQRKTQPTGGAGAPKPESGKGRAKSGKARGGKAKGGSSSEAGGGGGGSGGGGSKSFDGKCFSCGGSGHRAANCPNSGARRSGGDDGALFMAVDPELERFDGKFIIDSGASQVSVPDASIIHNFKPFVTPRKIRTGSGLVNSLGVGTVWLRYSGAKDGKLRVSEVQLMPQVPYNLFGIGNFVDKGLHEVVFDNITCKVVSKTTGEVLVTVPRANQGPERKLYVMEATPIMPGESASGSAMVSQQDAAQRTAAAVQRVHESLGHVAHKTIGGGISSGKLVGISLPAAAFSGMELTCEACNTCKQERQPFPKVSNRVTELMELVHTDIAGPFKLGHKGERYFVTVLEDSSTMAFATCIGMKSQAAKAVKDMIQRLEAMTGKQLRFLRSDNGPEYLSREVVAWLEDKGIQSEHTVVYSSQQNGKAERLNKTLEYMARTQLTAAGLPVSMWPRAVEMAAYQRNRVPSYGAPGTKTPWELLTGKVPDVSHMQPFGAPVTVLIPKTQRISKMHPVSASGRMVGYPLGTKGYLVMLDDSQRILISRDVTFVRSIVQPAAPPAGGIVVDFDLNEEPALGGGVTAGGQPGMGSTETGGLSDGPTPMEVDRDDLAIWRARNAARESAVEQRRSTRPSLGNRPARFDGFLMAATGIQISDIVEPRNFKEAERSQYAAEWSAARADEFQSIQDQGVLEPVSELPLGRKALPTHCVYKAKLRQDGTVERFKARLVVGGHLQQRGADYEEVYAPASKHTTFRALLAMAAARGWVIHQLDVKTAFLNATLEEDVYVTLPPELQGGGGKVTYRLRKALYGLRQAPRAWAKDIHAKLTAMGFKVSSADPALYISADGLIMVSKIHVDDIMIVAPTDSVAATIKTAIRQKYNVTDQGEIAFYLGMEVQRDWDRGLIALSQRKFTAEVLERFGNQLANGRVIGTPVDPCIKLVAEGELLSDTSAGTYRELVGSLMYLAVCTRPDIAQSVGALARYMSNPTEQHMTAARSVLRYVSGTKDMGVVYGQGSGIIGYCDSNHGGDLDTRRSTTAYAFLAEGGIISWSSRLQPTVATSTTEAEYIAAAAATKEALWLRKLLPELGYELETVQIYGDNQAALKIIANPIVSERSKHIDIIHHFVRERVEMRQVKLDYVDTSENVADILTKALPAAGVARCRSSMGITDVA